MHKWLFHLGLIGNDFLDENFKDSHLSDEWLARPPVKLFFSVNSGEAMFVVWPFWDWFIGLVSDSRQWRLFYWYYHYFWKSLSV